MCTASWFHGPRGYELFFNRDELRTRRRAVAPAVVGRRGSELLMPVDTDAGGTWIAVNRHAVTVALLNRYQDVADPETTDRRRSRGLLVKDLADAPSAAQVMNRLREVELPIYSPFTLLVLAPGLASMAAWDGRRLSAVQAAVAPLASSGHDPLAVPATRAGLWAARFAERAPDRESCLAFHRSHAPERGASSPCMHRGDARTVSLTHVVVDGRRVGMAYADGPPCGHPLGVPVTMARLATAAAA